MKRKIICIALIILILQYFCTFVFAENIITNEVTTNTVDEETQELEKQKEEVENKINETNEK